MSYLTLDYWKDLVSDLNLDDADRRRHAIKLAAAAGLLLAAAVLVARAAGSRDAGGMHGVFAALSLEDADAVRRVVEADDDAVRATDVEGNTPLHVAASYGSVPIVVALLDAGADANAVNREGLTPLALAVREANKPFDAAQVLIARGAKADAPLPGGRTLLHVAAATPRIDPRVVDLIARPAGAPGLAQARDDRGRTPLQVAQQSGDARHAAAFRRASAAAGGASASAQQ